MQLTLSSLSRKAWKETRPTMTQQWKSSRHTGGITGKVQTLLPMANVNAT